MAAAAPQKRLIVCCDGTWEDSLADTHQPPTNVTRISRVLSRNAIVEENGVKTVVPQIVYYQKGVGSGLGNQLLGGAVGLGLSANVRAGYGFLADNYNEGDQIYFFGFSRGAYTARAIAGLVLELGLLTSKGMDNFTIIYNDYYKHKAPSYSEERRRELGFRYPHPKIEVEIIGVWDTVSFHKLKWLGKLLGVREEIEFANTTLHPHVKYAFQALSLDENRAAFQPVLWQIPEDRKDQELHQVWFSGVHTDVGGGATDPRLSNIPLAWMISHCQRTNLLSFDIESYLFSDPPKALESAAIPWATSLGAIFTPWSFSEWFELTFLGKCVRTPLAYKPLLHLKSGITNEKIHESVNDRNCFGPPAKSVLWPCRPLTARKNEQTYSLADEKEIVVVEATDAEKFMKGRIRTVHPDRVD